MIGETSYMKMSLSLALLLATILLVTSCGRDRAPDTPPPHNPYAPPPPVAGAATLDVDETLTAARGNIHTPQDFLEQTITIATLTPNAIHAMQLPSRNREPDPAISTNYQRDRRIWDNARRVERQFNFIIEETIPAGPARMQHLLRSSSLAGDAFADIVVAAPELTLAAAVGEWVHRLDEIDLPGSDLLGPQLYSRFVAEGFDHAWAFYTSEPDITAFTIGVNLDIIDAIGAPNPVQLYHSGQWTWDAMLDIMRLATRDISGDGEIDQWGISTHMYSFLMHMVAANDGVLITDSLELALDHPATVEAVEFVRTIIREELYRAPLHVSESGFIVLDYSCFHDSASVFITDTTWLRERWSDNRPPPYPVPSFEFAVLPLPIGPSSTSDATWMGGWREGLLFPHGADHTPASLLTVIEEYFSWPGDDIHFIHNIPITWGDGILLDNESAMRHLNTANNARFDTGLYLLDRANAISQVIIFHESTISELLWTTFPRRAETRPVVELVDELREPVQLVIDNFFR